ncbi:MAG TPA: FkbM family methyltransferase [Allocoleopsis sp.]
MPTIRQSLVANLTRLYPLYSGCGTFANKPFIQKLAGTNNESVWSQVPGGEILVPLNDYVGRAAFYVGDLDRKITWICAQIVRPGDTVLDIGANIGMVTLWLSTLVGKSGKVHAFEPNPKLQKMLEETLNHNQVSNVCLHPVALGAEQGSLELRIPRVNAGAASLIRNGDLIDCDVVEVPVRTLSEIVEEEGIKSIRLIKIDVEGFEAEVLKGGQDVLGTIRPEAILFELNERLEGAVRDQPVIKILSDFGYGFFSIPRCLFRMHLEYFDPNTSNALTGNDFLAVPKGKFYEDIAKLVNVSV